MITNNNHYFLLQPRAWPFVARFSTFNLMFSLLLFIKHGNTLIFFINLFHIFLCSFLWWICYSKELNKEGVDSNNLESGIKFSVILFIISEVFFFFSMFWRYFHFYLAPVLEIRGMWPPELIIPFSFENVPIVNTLILLTSGVTVTISHIFNVEGKYKTSLLFLFFTIMLGLSFSYFQFVEYNNSFFRINDATFGTSFFILTGFHGLHVLIGTIFLIVSIIIGFKVISNKNIFTIFELASWYWHFVDVVWVFLFFFLYYINV